MNTEQVTPTPGPVDIATVEDAWTWIRQQPGAPSTEHVHSLRMDTWLGGTVHAHLNHHLAWLAWVQWLGLDYKKQPVGTSVVFSARGWVLADGRHIDIHLTFTQLGDPKEGA